MIGNLATNGSSLNWRTRARIEGIRVIEVVCGIAGMGAILSLETS